MKKVLGSKLAITLFCLPGLLLFVIFVLYPLYDVIVYSFQSYDGINPGKFVGLKNYILLWNMPDFWEANVRSLYLCGLTMLVDTVFVSIFALIIVGLKPFFQKAYKIAFLLPFVLSISVISQMWLAIYHPEWGILNSVLEAVGLGQFAQGWLLNPDIAMICIGFVGMWWIFGMQMLLIYTGYRSIPENYFEAAQIDGANYFQSSIKIALPLLTNVIRLSLIMTAVGGLYTFPQVYIMTRGGPGGYTETLMMYMYKQIFSNLRFGLGSAIAFIAILETCVILGTITLLTRRERIQY